MFAIIWLIFVAHFYVFLHVCNSVRLYDRTLMRAYAHFLQLYGLQLIRLNTVSKNIAESSPCKPCGLPRAHKVSPSVPTSASSINLSSYSLSRSFLASPESVAEVPKSFLQNSPWSTLHLSVWHTGTFYRPAASACVLSLRLGLGGMREA